MGRMRRRTRPDARLRPDPAGRGGVKSGSLAAVVLIHLLAATAPLCATRAGAAAFAILYLLTGQLGINLGYHRLLSHRSFRTPLAVERGLALCGTLALQIGPISWGRAGPGPISSGPSPPTPCCPTWSAGLAPRETWPGTRSIASWSAISSP
jgi:hypothetical protein